MRVNRQICGPEDHGYLVDRENPTGSKEVGLMDPTTLAHVVRLFQWKYVSRNYT